MKIHGRVFFGVHRGGGVVEKYHARLIGLVGFRPYKGTLNVRVSRGVDIKPHATKAISHKINDGSTFVDAYLAPVRISTGGEKRRLKGIPLEGNETVSTYKWKNRDAFSLRKEGKFVTWGLIENEEERKIINELKELENSPKGTPGKVERRITSALTCWVILPMSGPQEKDVIEIISEQKLADLLDMQDGSEVEIEFLK